MEYIDRSLRNINKEIDEFTPKNYDIKYDTKTESILQNWMQKFCNVYHQLVLEFFDYE
jgi:hypothetical protein